MPESDDKRRSPAAAAEAMLREALPVLAGGWDGELDRVALVVEREPPRFIDRVEAVDRVSAWAATFGKDGAAASRAALETKLPPDNLHFILEGSDGRGVVQLPARDLERYVTGDFDSPSPTGNSEITAAAVDPEVAAALVTESAARLPDGLSPALEAVVVALQASPDDYEAILAKVDDAIVDCRPLYGTAAGQNMGMVLNCIARATRGRATAARPYDPDQGREHLQDLVLSHNTAIQQAIADVKSQGAVDDIAVVLIEENGTVTVFALPRTNAREMVEQFPVTLDIPRQLVNPADHGKMWAAVISVAGTRVFGMAMQLVRVRAPMA